MKLSNQFVASAITASALSLIAAYGMAQGKPAAPGKKPAAPAAANPDAGPPRACPHSECKHEGMGCPMRALSALAEVKVEKTKTGASLHITAKDPGELTEVQALAEKVAEHIATGACSMLKAGEGHPPGHHHHGPAPAK